MTGVESHVPPHGGENEVSQAEQYAAILGRMCLAENRTDMFKESGLRGRKIVGFHALLLENGQLSVVVHHTAPQDAYNQKSTHKQPLDIHPAWEPFVPDVLKSLREWAGLPAWEQDRARLGAEALRMAPPQKQDIDGLGLADVIVAKFDGTRERSNEGPFWGNSS
jgi:hypothetical protein